MERVHTLINVSSTHILCIQILLHIILKARIPVLVCHLLHIYLVWLPNLIGSLIFGYYASCPLLSSACILIQHTSLLLHCFNVQGMIMTL